MLVMMAAESISEESKRPDLLVVKPSAVLSRLGLLEAVEVSWDCVACRRSRASPDCQPQKFHPGLKEVVVGK